MMLKRIIITNVTISAVILAVLGIQLGTDNQSTDAAALNEKVTIQAANSAVKSLEQQVVGSKLINQSPTTDQSSTQVKQPSPSDELNTNNEEKMSTENLSVHQVSEKNENAQIVVSTDMADTDTATANILSVESDRKSNQTSADINWLITHESHGDTQARNGDYYGIGQLSEAYYAKYVPGQDYHNNYDVQLDAMQQYINERYGSVEQAISHWQQNNWY